MLLRKDDPWSEKLPIPDLRNWRVFDRQGRMVGFVESLVVDWSSNTFEALLIGANERFPAADIEIGEGVIRVNRPLTLRPDEEDHYRELPSDFQKAYRNHFQRTYGAGARTFEDLLPAYHFGREIAYDADFSARSFASAEADLRGYYVSREIRPSFNVAREAIRCAYTLVHRGRTSAQGGLDRDARQTLGELAGESRHPSDVGSAMSSVPAREDRA